jgi:hypothetical protein
VTTYFERDYANGKTVVRVDGRHMEVVFIEHTGAVHQFHCEGTNARLDELLMASEDDEFDPQSLDGWEPGAEHIRVRFEE